jgi:CRISPR-associated exonuclease Cas4
MHDEEDLLPLSALQHLLFCPRQCALIHLELAWQENVLTVEGRQLHDKTDQAGTETRGGVRIARGVRLRSLRLGLSGRSDVVEFHPAPGGGWRPFPVEYKHGHPKAGRCDEVQLCAQALCLEEMLGVAVPAGALFYGQTRRRTDITFDPSLRELTESTAGRLHDLFDARTTPPPEFGPKCGSCSLAEICLPKTAAGRRSATYWLESQLHNPVKPGEV